MVGADEREDGRRAVLNLGHTFAHAIESLLHGVLELVELLTEHFFLIGCYLFEALEQIVEDAFAS